MLVEEFNMLIEITAENIFHGLDDITTEISDKKQTCYILCIPRLLKNMEVLNKEYQRSAERLEVIFPSLLGVLKEAGEQLEDDSTFDI